MMVYFIQASSKGDKHRQNDGQIDGEIFFLQTAPSQGIKLTRAKCHHRQNQQQIQQQEIRFQAIQIRATPFKILGKAEQHDIAKAEPCYAQAVQS